MTFNNNVMNPVPLWPSKTYWQCKQATYHGAMAWAVMPTGTLPKMALTISGTLPNPASNTVSVFITNCTDSTYNRQYEGASFAADGSGDMTLIGLRNQGEGTVTNMPRIILTQYDNETYTGKIRRGTTATLYTIYEMETGSQYLRREVLEAGGGLFKIRVNSDDKTFNLGPIDLQYHGNSTASIAVKKLEDNTQVATATETMYIDGCLPYNTDSRKGQVWIGGQILSGTFSDAVYYMEVTFDNTTYYSEPFFWLTTLSNYTIVEYRRSQPIITTENYIKFKDRSGVVRNLVMYLPNIEQKPHFQFNTDVVEIDGRKYAEKQVSYKADRTAFNCYEAFLDAIRLLWHCDVRYVGGKRIDYMEPPEMDWSSDNHLCNVNLEFQRDTVVQTNGMASAYIDSSDSEHTAYDSSFDESFA